MKGVPDQLPPLQESRKCGEGKEGGGVERKEIRRKRQCSVMSPSRAKIKVDPADGPRFGGRVHVVQWSAPYIIKYSCTNGLPPLSVTLCMPMSSTWVSHGD